jgi:hypothetical protein
MGVRPDDAAKDGFGCLLVLVLGAILTSGLLLALVLMRVWGSHSPNEHWPWLLIWIVCPATGIALITVAICGVGSRRSPKRPGTSWRRRG